MNSLLQFLETSGVKLSSVSQSEESLIFCLDIWAKPGAKVEKHLVGPEGELIVYVKEKAIEGAANKAFINALSKIFKTPKSNIVLDRGSKSKFKTFKVILTFTDRKDLSYYLKNIRI